MPHHSLAGASPGFVGSAAAWFAMMALMMAPTVWPWVRWFHRLGRADGRSNAAATGMFAFGYLTAWLGYSVGAARLQSIVQIPEALAPILLAGAGLYQFAPLKRACLAHCRSPLTYFLARWRNGPRGAFRMGLGHGIFCVGCCWALMTTMLVTGLASVWWMVLLAAATFIEQVSRPGGRLRAPLGAALIAFAILRTL